MSDYMAYTPQGSEWEGIQVGSYYHQVWNGLPNLEFKQTKSSGGHDSLVCEQDGNYVWVTTDAVKQLRLNSVCTLVALVTKTKDRKINAWCVDAPNLTFGEELEQVISRAKELNSKLPGK